MAHEDMPAPTAFDLLSDKEKEELLRAELFHTHKVRGSLGTFYYLFPDLAPPPRPRTVEGGLKGGYLSGMRS